MTLSARKLKLLGIVAGSALAVIVFVILFPHGEEKPSVGAPTAEIAESDVSSDLGPRSIASASGKQTLSVPRAAAEKEPESFKNLDFVAQVTEALTFFDTDLEKGLVQLQLAMENIDPAKIGEVLVLLRAKLPVTDEEVSPAAYGVVYGAWGRENGKAAVEHAMNNLPENIVRQFAGVEAVKSWAQRDAASAAAMVAGLPDTFAKDNLLFEIPNSFIEQDAQAAMAWATNLAPIYRQDTLAYSMQKWLETDPQAAQLYARGVAGQSVSPIPGTEVLMSRTATHLLKQSPDSALSWIDTLPAGWARQEAKVALADRWTDTNPEAASQWMTTLHSGPETDLVVEKFAEIASYIDPAAAADWATTITQDTLKKNRISEVLEVWAVTDEAASKDWAQKNGYSNLVK